MNISKEQLLEIAECHKSCEYFLDNYAWIVDPVKGKIRFKLYDYQRDLLVQWNDFTHHEVILKSRQVGMSWLFAGFALWRILFYSGTEILEISKREKDAVRLLWKSKYIFQNLPDFMRPAITSDNYLEFRISDLGSGIEALSASEDAGRSKGATIVFIDEGAFLPHSEKIWSSLKPTTTGGGKLIVGSTPNGCKGMFYRLWTSSDVKFRKTVIHYSKVPGRDPETPDGVDWLQKAQAGMSEEQWRQEMECDFMVYMGKVYKNFSREIHVKKLKYDPSLELYQAWDFGYRNATVCLWFQIDKFGIVKFLKEYYMRSLRMNQHIEAVKEIEKQNGWQSVGGFADPEDPEAISELNVAGFKIARSISDGKRRRNVVLNYLEIDSVLQSPRLLFDISMKITINEHENYRFPEDEENRELTEKPLKVKDHSVDSVQYALVMIEKMNNINKGIASGGEYESEFAGMAVSEYDW